MPGEQGHRDRLIAVGDIHGCLDKLTALLEQIAPTSRDQVVFIGDYIDRGPDSRGVVDCLLDFRERFPATVCLKGNHESMLLGALTGNEAALQHFLFNGGSQTVESYGALEAIPDRHLDFFHALPLWYETEQHFFVHAGVNPARDLCDQEESDLLWIRRPFLESNRIYDKTIVHGHTPCEQPVWRQRGTINVDTGAVYARNGRGHLGRLTGMDVLSGRVWQA